MEKMKILGAAAAAILATGCGKKVGNDTPDQAIDRAAKISLGAAQGMYARNIDDQTIRNEIRTPVRRAGKVTDYVRITEVLPDIRDPRNNDKPAFCINYRLESDPPKLLRSLACAPL
jgi:hypothetical protein